MATKKLLDILGGKKRVSFEFTSLEKDLTNDGQIQLKLTLKDPIPMVEGSQTVTDEDSGKTERLRAYDVDMVTVSPDAIEAIDEMETAGKTIITWDEEGVSGKIECDLRLDVTKRTGEVRLVKDSLASFGSNQRRNNRRNSDSKTVSRLADLKAKNDLAGIIVNPTVVGETTS